MNILEQEIKDYCDALEKLGIIINIHDITDENISNDNVRVSFKTFDQGDTDKNMIQVYKSKRLIDLNKQDIADARCYKLFRNYDEKEIEEITSAYNTLDTVLGYDDEFDRLNTLLIEKFTKAQEAQTTDFILVNEEDVIRNNNVDEVIDVDGEVIDEVLNDDEKVDDVEEVKEDSELVIKAKKFIKDNSLIVVSSLALVGAVAYALSRSGSDVTTVDKDGNITTISYNTEDLNNGETPVEENSENNENTQVEETQNATEVYENEEEVVVEVDPHSEEAINATIDKVYEEIQTSDNEDFKIEYDRDTVEALVRYAHHSYSEYTGENYISNTDAYDRFTNLYKNNINIANLFENLDNYERLNNLVTKCQSVKEEKGVYSDEYEAYASIKDCMDNLNADNYPEVIAIRVAVDNTMSISSMQLSRGGALENIAAESEFQEVNENGEVVTNKVKELWIDVNGDGKITYEENAEGEDYEKEKKIASINKDELLAIFNSVDINNENAPLTQATYKAIDEDEALGLIK